MVHCWSWRVGQRWRSWMRTHCWSRCTIVSISSAWTTSASPPATGVRFPERYYRNNGKSFRVSRFLQPFDTFFYVVVWKCGSADNFRQTLSANSQIPIQQTLSANSVHIVIFCFLFIVATSRISPRVYFFANFICIYAIFVVPLQRFRLPKMLR